MKIEQDGGSARYNKGKPRFDLIPPDALMELARVYTDGVEKYGAEKYGARNWERGQKWGICFGATMRHMWKWWGGERYNPESGLPHLAHAAWNVFVLLAYELRGMTELDDRNHLKTEVQNERLAARVAQED